MTPSSSLYQLKAQTSQPGAVVELHAPPPNYIVKGPMNRRDMSPRPVPYNGSFGSKTRHFMGEVRKELNNCQEEIKNTQVKLEEISNNSNQLLSLFLCDREKGKEAECQSRVRAMEGNPGQPHTNGAQPQMSLAPQPHQTAEQQDPAIIVIQPPPSPPPQSVSIPSSVPSLASISETQDEDSDIEMLNFIPERNRMSFPRESTDPVAQLAAGAQNLLL